MLSPSLSPSRFYFCPPGRLRCTPRAQVTTHQPPTVALSAMGHGPPIIFQGTSASKHQPNLKSISLSRYLRLPLDPPDKTSAPQKSYEQDSRGTATGISKVLVGGWINIERSSGVSHLFPSTELCLLASSDAAPLSHLHSFHNSDSNPSRRHPHIPASHERLICAETSLIPRKTDKTMPFDRFRHGRRR